MTSANWITLLRLFLVPVFAYFSIRYSQSWQAGSPDEAFRWAAIAAFTLAAATDGIDGWLARKQGQESLMGAILDPLTDKALLLTAIIIFSIMSWGDGWLLPVWFTILVIARDIVIIVGIWILYFINRRVPIKPHWTGKVCTVTQMVAVSWLMLKFLGISPLIPTVVAAFFTIWSGLAYIQTGISLLPQRTR